MELGIGDIIERERKDIGVIVELISVGTELLMGNIINTNAAYLAGKCAQLGLTMYHQTTVGDNPGRLLDAAVGALKRSDVVIFTGGLGPTRDDLTKETIAKAMGKKLVRDPQWEETIRSYFADRGISSITENNWKQADVIEGARIVPNSNGTACGEIVQDENKKTAILLPGPPQEMKPMFDQWIYPYLKERSGQIFVSRMAKVAGVGESSAETKLLDLIDGQTNPTIAPYAKTGEVHFRVTAKADTEKEAERLLEPVLSELSRRFGDDMYTMEESIAMEDCLIAMCRDRGWTLTTAESLTGGAIVSRLVNVPGASEAIGESFVVYTEAAKHRRLGVGLETLERFGAVSAETAEEMARGAQKAAGAELSIAVTGIAGPGGGTEEKPVGLVFLGCCVKEKAYTKQCRFQGNREKIRENTTAAALTFARRCILESEKTSR